MVIGCDISMDMLQKSRAHFRSTLSPRFLKHVDLVRCDFGQGLPFRQDLFDCAVSISALQWLNTPAKLSRLFGSLNGALRPGARAAFQYYADSAEYMELVVDISRQEALLASSVLDLMHRTTKTKWVHFVQKPLPHDGAQQGPQPLPWCPLSYPFHTSCSLAVRCCSGTTPASLSLHSDPRTQPMAQWAYRAHLDYALNLMYYSTGRVIPGFTPRKNFHPESSSIQMIKHLLALFPSQVVSWAELVGNFDKVIEILHSAPPPNQSSLWTWS